MSESTRADNKVGPLGKFYTHTLIAIFRVSLYIIPPITQILFIVFANHTTALTVITINQVIISLLSLLGGFFLAYHYRKYKNYFKGIHDVHGIYYGLSILTYIAIPTLINLSPGVILKYGSFIITIIIIPMVIFGAIIGYLVLETNIENLMVKIRKTMAVINCITLLIAFPVIQITFSAIYEKGSKIILTTIWVYALLQSLIGGYGIWRLSYNLTNADKNVSCPAPCRFNITKFKSVVSGGYILYMLLLWVPVQLIVAWLNHPYMDNVEKLIIYVPLLGYIIAATIGYSEAYLENVDKYEENESTKLIVNVDNGVNRNY